MVAAPSTVSVFGAFSRSIELPSGVDAYRSRRRRAMAWSRS
jgi:hypothetical protein